MIGYRYPRQDRESELPLEPPDDVEEYDEAQADDEADRELEDQWERRHGA